MITNYLVGKELTVYLKNEKGSTLGDASPKEIRYPFQVEINIKELEYSSECIIEEEIVLCKKFVNQKEIKSIQQKAENKEILSDYPGIEKAYKNELAKIRAEKGTIDRNKYSIFASDFLYEAADETKFIDD